jgi:hypothetical protein
MSRTKAVTGSPRCQRKSFGSQAISVWPRDAASRIIAKVLSL